MTQQLELDYCDEYYDLLPRPRSEERRSLKNSIQSDGQLTPIIVNEKGIILDGHTRWEICLELRIKTDFIVKKFKTKEEEKRFVIMSNIARRNLTLFQKCELAWEIYESEKVKASARECWRKNYDPGYISKGDELDMPDEYKKQGNASEIFGKYLGTGHTMIGKIEWLKNNGSKQILQELRDGTIAINKAYDLERGLSHITYKHTKKSNKVKKIEKVCPECQCDTILVSKKPCHVHTKLCCTTCKWGY